MDYRFIHMLIPTMLLLIGMILYLAPPKKINSFFGYRTQLSMSNQELWYLGNKVFSKFLIIGAVYLILINVASLFIQGYEKEITIFYLCSVVALFVIMFTMTQRKLKRQMINKK